MPRTPEGHLYTGYTIKDSPMPSQLSLPFEPEHFDEDPEILVIGDYLTDRWIECDSVRLSAEAPVLAGNAIKTTFCHGGAGNVAKNLLEMGWNPAQVYQASSGTSPVKIRYIYKGTQLFRADEQDKIEYPIRVTKLEAALANASARGLPVVVADYNKGAIDDKCQQLITNAINNTDLSFYIHCKYNPHLCYGGGANVTYFYNDKEYENAIQADWLPDSTHFVVTKGSAGARYFVTYAGYHPVNDKTTCAPIPSSVRSTCGAGDVFMAAYITAKELYGHPNPLAIADAIAKKTVTECDYTCVYRGGF